MTERTWYTWLGIHVLLAFLQAASIALAGGSETCDAGYLCALPIERGLDSTDALDWNALSFNPLTLVASGFTLLKSMALGLWGLLAFDYPILTPPEDANPWLGLPRLLFQAVSFIGGVLAGYKVVSRLFG